MTREAITQLLKGSAPQSKSVGQSFSLITANGIIEQIRLCSNASDFILGGARFEFETEHR